MIQIYMINKAIKTLNAQHRYNHEGLHECNKVEEILGK